MWIQRLTSYQFSIPFCLRGGQKNLVQKKPFQEIFTKDSALVYNVVTMF